MNFREIVRRPLVAGNVIAVLAVFAAWALLERALVAGAPEGGADARILWATASWTLTVSLGVLILSLRSQRRATHDLERRVQQRTAELTRTNAAVHAELAERRRVEEALRKSEERCRAFLEHSAEGMWCFEQDEPLRIDQAPDEQIEHVFRHAYLSECNDAFARMYGLKSARELIGARLGDLLVPTDPNNIDYLRTFFQSGFRITDAETHEVDAQGNIKYFLNNLFGIVENGVIVRIWGTQRDITPRKQMEEALRASQAMYHSLVENLSQSIFLKDRDGRFVAVNKSFCEAVGRSADAILGQTDFDLYPNELAEKYRVGDRHVMETGKRVEQDEQNVISGKKRTVRVVKTPLCDGQGQVSGVLGIFWDVTEQYALEAQLRQSQKMEAVGQLAGGIAHDFNNLLTAILGNLALTLNELPEAHASRELLSSAERAATRAAELTRQLLGFSRRAMLKSEPTDCNRCLAETAQILSRTLDPRIVLDVKSEPGLWTVQGDAGQIGQVLLNLCINARDAMPDGGRLLLETQNLRLTSECVALRPEARAGEFVRLRISDTGHGMTPEVKARIFEPFFTTKEPGKGTGLGLAMVFGIVKQHQGWIDCYTEVGHGTRFDIYLPRSRQEARVAPIPAPKQAIGGSETVLLVDDEPLICKLGKTILQRYGYRVLVAEDGLHALEVYQQAGSRIDLVLLDLTMPRLSGRDAFRRLREINPNVCVLFASGYSVDHAVEAQEEQGAGFVGKPYRPEELARKVRAAIDESRRRLAIAETVEVASLESLHSTELVDSDAAVSAS